MTAMPQRIAISHTFGALAATLVGVAEYYTLGTAREAHRLGTMAALGFEVLLGALTVTGSFMAFGKLQELLPAQPVTYHGPERRRTSRSSRSRSRCSCYAGRRSRARRRRSTR